jgi:hypothetical protein
LAVLLRKNFSLKKKSATKPPKKQKSAKFFILLTRRHHEEKTPFSHPSDQIQSSQSSRV